MRLFLKIFNPMGKLDNKEFTVLFLLVVLPLVITVPALLVFYIFGDLTFGIVYEYILSLFPFKSQSHSYNLYKLISGTNIALNRVLLDASLRPYSIPSIIGVLVFFSVSIQRLRSIFKEFNFILLILLLTVLKFDLLLLFFIFFLMTARSSLNEEDSRLGRFVKYNEKNINLVIILIFIFSIIWGLPLVQIKLNSISNNLSKSAIIKNTKDEENKELVIKLKKSDRDIWSLKRKAKLSSESLENFKVKVTELKKKLADTTEKSYLQAEKIKELKEFIGHSNNLSRLQEYKVTIERRDASIKDLESKLKKKSLDATLKTRLLYQKIQDLQVQLEKGNPSLILEYKEKIKNKDAFIKELDDEITEQDIMLDKYKKKFGPL